MYVTPFNVPDAVSIDLFFGDCRLPGGIKGRISYSQYTNV